MSGVKPKGPLNRASTEHQSSAWRTVHGHVMCGRAPSIRFAKIEEQISRQRVGRRSHVEQAGGAKTVVEILVPLKTQCSRR